MKAKDRKKEAQDELLHAMCNAFTTVRERGDVPEEVIEEMDKQLRRVESLFNYEPGSWIR